MTLSSSHQSPSAAADTPDPYRLATTAVRLPRPITDAEHAAIRAEIQPRTAFWQFELRPWHYWTALGAAGVIAVAFVVLLVTTGAIR